MIYINAPFDTRREAEDFARAIEESYPTDKFETALTIQRIPTPGSDTKLATFLVVGTRQEKPL